MIPSPIECLNIMDKYRMLDNIKAHSLMVARVAYLIGTSAALKAPHISVDLVLAGALLHDIGKTESLRNGGDHVEIGQKICRIEGLAEVEPIVAEHVVLKSFVKEGEITEKEIVYYADKRVNHDQVVSLKKRLEYILERYGCGNPKVEDLIIRNFNVCSQVEEKLFQYLEFEPSDIEHLAPMIELPLNGQGYWQGKGKSLNNMG